MVIDKASDEVEPRDVRPDEDDEEYRGSDSPAEVLCPVEQIPSYLLSHFD